MSQGSGAHILVIDDEPGILRAVQTNLGRHDFRVDTATTASEGIAAYGRLRPDLVLLDLGLPDMDGLEVIREIRRRSSTPIVVLSAREAERHKVAALDLGADDYLTKPFGVNELLARVRVALRHAARPLTGTEAVIRLGELEVDLERRKLSVADVEVHLTPTEWDLVKLFAAHPDKLLTDQMLLNEIWGPAKRPSEHTLHVYVARLRQKIEVYPESPRYLVTETGAGYRLATEPDRGA